MKKGLGKLLLVGSIAVTSWAAGVGQGYFARPYIDLAVTEPKPLPVLESISFQEVNNYPLDEPLDLWAPERPKSISGKFYAFDRKHRPYVIKYDGVNSTMSIERANLMGPLNHKFASSK